jgi:hypothetical protein
MASQGEVVVEDPDAATYAPATPAFELFVVHDAADADFVRGYLLPALAVAPPRVLLVDELTPDAGLVSELARGVARSRSSIAVLSPAYLEHRWAVFGDHREQRRHPAGLERGDRAADDPAARNGGWRRCRRARPGRRA